MIDHPSNRCDGGHVPTEGRPELCHMHMERKAQEAEAAEQLAREKFPEAFNDVSLVAPPIVMTRDEAKADAEEALRAPQEPVCESLPDDLGARAYPDASGTLMLPSEGVGGASGTWEYAEGLDPLVHHPAHYRGHPKEIECIDIIEDCPRPNLANCIKYIWRVSWGSKGNDLQDLQKAHWYLSREIQRRGGQLP